MTWRYEFEKSEILSVVKEKAILAGVKESVMHAENLITGTPFKSSHGWYIDIDCEPRRGCFEVQEFLVAVDPRNSLLKILPKIDQVLAHEPLPQENMIAWVNGTSWLLGMMEEKLLFAHDASVLQLGIVVSSLPQTKLWKIKFDVEPILPSDPP